MTFPISPQGRRGSAPTDAPSGRREETIERTWRFTNGIEVGALKLSFGLNGDLLKVGANGEVIATSSPDGDYTFTGAITINGTDLIVEVDSLSLLSLAESSLLIGTNGQAGRPVYVGDDAPAVAAERLGKVDLAAQTADITTTALSSTPLAGMYEVEVYLMTTTADAAAGTLAVTIGWTDAVGATTANVIAAHALTGTGRSTGRQILNLASSDITYAVTNAGGYGTSAYAIAVRVVSLG